MIPRPSPQGATEADFASLCEENQALRSALMALPAIAEEIRQQWDVGMKSGKLLIALTDPGLRYRKDITQIHDAAKLAQAREESLYAALQALLTASEDLYRDQGLTGFNDEPLVTAARSALALARGAAPDGGANPEEKL